MKAVKWLVGMGLLGALASGPSACASPRDEINRVQPNHLPKSMFVSKDARGAWLEGNESWYFRATVIDAPAANAVPAYIGTAGGMSRVKWRIEEQYLLAINEYPDVEGSGDTKGGVVAAFPILSHFDIVRSWNPTTGESTNVVEENTTDRPWWAREYIRVDWSTNKISEKQFEFPAYESVSAATYYVQDPKSKDAPVFEKDYFDITAHYTVQPTPSTCFYLYQQYGCAPGSVAARLSFMKVPQRDYVPRDYPDRVPLKDEEGNILRSPSGAQYSLPMQDQFGFFRVERAVYDPRFGTLEKRFVYRARIWNLWEKWFVRDAKGEVVYETVDGKIDKNKPKLLPYAERKVRPIVFHLNDEWPAEMKPMAREVGEGWNDAFQETVASLRLIEKKGAGAVVTHDELRAEVSAMKARNEDVFVVCLNSPVKKGDPEVCGPEGTVARLGDQRRSFMYWVNKQQPTGPLGLGPSYSDPYTGELFSAGAHIYGAALDKLAQQGVEVVNLLNGKYKANDYIDGVATDLYAKRLVDGDVPGPQSAFADGSKLPGMPGFDLSAMQKHLEKTLDRPMLAAIAKHGPAIEKSSTVERLKLIKGTPLERAILDNPETRALFGHGKEQALSDDELKQVADNMLGVDQRKIEEERARFLGEHDCFYPTNFADDAVIGLAKELLKKYGTGATPVEDERIQKAMWQDIRHAYGKQVTEHEIGHTLGMAHNFEGSADPINFFDEYWKLKGDKPVYGQPLTQAQKDGKMVEYQYSTVMDYTSRFNSEIHGLGKYDYAAVRFAYGNVVETWPAGKVIDPLYQVDPTKFGAYNLGFQGYSAELLDYVNRNYRHYTQIPGQFSDGTKSLMKAGRELRAFDDVVAQATKLYRSAPVERRGGVKTGNWKPSAVSAKIYDTSTPIDVVPYRWCGDRLAGSVGRPLCERWDVGMDGLEVVQDAFDRYRNYYLFYAFSRGRTDGLNMLRSYTSSVHSRYFSHIHRQYIHWLFNGVYGSRDFFWTEVLGKADGVKNGYITDVDWFKDPAGGLPASIAVYWGLDRLVDVLGTPDVGVFKEGPSGAFVQTSSDPMSCLVAGNPTRCPSNDTQLTLDIADGARFRFTQYDVASGHDYFNRVKVVGSFYDKMAALLAITDSNANFVGQDTTNAVSYRIPFYLAYPRALSAVVGGIATDNVDQFAWRYQADPSAKITKVLSADIFSQLGKDDFLDPKVTGLPGKAIDSGWFLYYKAYALFFSMAEFQSNYSQSWNDAVRVFCLGCGEAFTPGATTPMITFVNPLSGKEYAAVKYGDGRFSPGAELITRGKTLAAAYDAALLLPEGPARNVAIANASNDLSEHVKLLDLIRGLYAVYGYSRF